MQQSPTLTRVFIANRGEICRRIATSARSLGIETVCLSERAENPPQFLQGLITTFVAVEKETPQLYLDIPKLIAHALAAKCDCLHPGFGFLSESSAFAAAVVDAGLTWIGPPARAIAAMASKDGARNIAIAQGVPCPRSYAQVINEPHLSDEISRAAEHIGYPLLVKAAGGGGGKGMRLVNSARELPAALEQAHHEAMNFFADGGLLLEQYLKSARHIEVQILADRHGQIFALGDRDCSLQRRKQKIIEEAPAPHLSATTRKSLHRYAIALAQAVDYVSAGTVEFLLKEGEGKSADEIYFLEMNTRLQVEHPVTEEVFGLDLVSLQFKIAMDLKLPATFCELEPRGHSIEARLYGEDPQRGFLPAPGFVPCFVPRSLPGIRWEIGLDPSDEVSSSFDPMIAKVIATADTRREALARLGLCLEQSFYSGPASNKELLIHFTSGPAAHLPWRTDSIEIADTHLLADLNRQRESQREEVTSLVSYLLASPEISGSLARASEPQSEAQDLIRATTRQAFIPTASSCLPKTTSSFRIDSSSHSTYQRTTIIAARGSFSPDGTNRHSWQCAAWRQKADTHLSLLWRGCEYHERGQSKVWRDHADESAHSGQQMAPVPGRIVKVSTTLGATVHKDECLFLLESMKMEFEVRATQSGLITALHVEAGAQVQSGQALATITTA
jgi:acetyl/propionyl-CoA carboxylase alpha subunit